MNQSILHKPVQNTTAFGAIFLALAVFFTATSVSVASERVAANAIARSKESILVASRGGTEKGKKDQGGGNHNNRDKKQKDSGSNSGTDKTKGQQTGCRSPKRRC